MRIDFTEGVRTTLARARDEALRLGHPYLGTEHLLMALLLERDSLAASVFSTLQVPIEEFRQEIEQRVPHGKSMATGAQTELPYTDRAKRALEHAMASARDQADGLVDSEHLLLGLLREKQGIAACVLKERGVTLAGAEQTLAELRGGAAAGSAFRIEVDDSSEVSIYEQIVATVREATATGELEVGERLPTVRRLADQLDIAPGTVARAYGELERLGVVTTEGARGTRVARRTSSAAPGAPPSDMLPGLLRPVAVAAFHMGATAKDLRDALEQAMTGIFDE